MLDQLPWGDVVETLDGTLSIRHPKHNECFHSYAGARLEADALYCKASGFLTALAERSQTRSHVPLKVLDVGLGLGYNALATYAAWRNQPHACSIQLLSLEMEESLVDQLRSGLGVWQRTWDDNWRDLCHQLKDTSGAWEVVSHHPDNGGTFSWRILVGDARNTLLTAPALAFSPWDFVWQDPFSPTKNPDLWNALWFSMLEKTASPNAVLATYSVARIVKDSLAASGWSWRLVPTGLGHKKQWLLAYRGDTPQ